MQSLSCLEEFGCPQVEEFDVSIGALQGCDLDGAISASVRPVVLWSSQSRQSFPIHVKRREVR